MDRFPSVAGVLAISCAFAMSESLAQVHMSPSGDDSGNGSEKRPVFSFSKAAALAGRSAKVIVHGGVYRIGRPAELDATASGTDNAPLVFEAAPGETPVITGAEPLALKWEKGEGGIWKTHVPTGTTADRLLLNGEEMILARYPNAKMDKYMGGVVPLEDICERAKTWRNSPIGAFLHGPHSQNWGSAHSQVTGVDATGKLILKGGWQVNQAPGHGKTAFIEGVLDELDAPGEWYLDSKIGELHVIPPVGLDLPKSKVEFVRASGLLRLCGSAGQPVRNIVLRGLCFMWTARTFMETQEPLLRGDWRIARQAALFIENAERITVENCSFNNLGGNAVFISRQAKDIAIRANEFSNLKASAVCFVGDPSSVRSPVFWNTRVKEPIDTAPGPQGEAYPRDCVVEDNLMHDFGELEKQTAGVIISMSARISVSHNSIFKCPRAGVCINDGTWGGHKIVGNDIFATVRETGDHGPFNAWGRDRHWIGSAKNGPQVKERSTLDSMEPTIIELNRFAHYWSTHSWGIDLDDGSSNYILRSNLCLGCAIKLREGYFRTVENNICVTAEPIAKQCCYENNDDAIRRNIFVNVKSDCAMATVLARPEWAKEIDFNLYFGLAEWLFPPCQAISYGRKAFIFLRGFALKTPEKPAGAKRECIGKANRRLTCRTSHCHSRASSILRTAG